MKFKKPYFWDYKKISFFSFLLLPFTLLLFLKNILVKSNKNKNNNIKTICVGNIYVGGTGKTPFTISLAEMLNKLKYKTAIIKKYYPDQIDEQKILNKKNSLYLGNKRIDSLNRAIKDKKKVAIFDDGLQQRSLAYDITFVCFNTDNWIGNGLLLPAGPLRERLSSLKNYDAVILSGNNKSTLNIKKKIKVINPNIEIFEAKYVPVSLKRTRLKEKYLIFSGIGNPKTFEKTLLINKFKIIKSIVFPDHYQYNDKNINRIKKLANTLNAKILTTEKDYMRLNKNNKKKINFLKINLVINNKKKLIRFLKKRL